MCYKWKGELKWLTIYKKEKIMDKSNFGKFCWNELAAPDTKAAKDFYGKLLGWEFIDHDMGDMTYTMIKSGDNECGGIWQIPADQQDQIPPHWMSYIFVESLEQTLEKAKNMGATIKVPVTQVAEMGRFAVIADPLGAHIAFWESLP